jgi:hypothetical protein
MMVGQYAQYEAKEINSSLELPTYLKQQTIKDTRMYECSIDCNILVLCVRYILCMYEVGVAGLT